MLPLKQSHSRSGAGPIVVALTASSLTAEIAPVGNPRYPPLRALAWAIITPMSCAQEAPPSEETLLITTTEAGRLVGRTNGAVRGALLSGSLAGERRRDRWFVKAADVIAWAAHTPPGHGPLLPVPRTEEVVGLLKEYGSASAEEVAKLLSAPRQCQEVLGDARPGAQSSAPGRRPMGARGRRPRPGGANSQLNE